MNFFGNIVENVINENGGNGPYSNVGKYVFHMCAKRNLSGGILKTGFERYFSGSQVAISYGDGVYTTLYPSADSRSKCVNPRLDVDERRYYYSHNNDWAVVMLKCKTPGLKGFMIYDLEVAEAVYGRKFKNYQEEIEYILDPDDVQDIKRKGTLDYLAGEGYTNWINGGGLIASRFARVIFNEYPKSNQKIRGFSFHGGHDGFVAIFRNFTDLTPVEVAEDWNTRQRYGLNTDLHFKPISVEPNFFAYACGNVDIYKELNVVDRFDGKTNRRKGSLMGLPWNARYDILPAYLLGDFARVQKDGKYNYIYRNTLKQGPISDVWFDKAQERFTKYGTLVQIEGENILIKQSPKKEDENKNVFYAYVPAYEHDNEEDVWIGPLRLYSKDRMQAKLADYFSSQTDFNKDFEAPEDEQPTQDTQPTQDVQQAQQTQDVQDTQVDTQPPNTNDDDVVVDDSDFDW